MKQAVHGLFAKVQQKTGLGDKKIDEFQKKWLEVPETRTKYKHWWDAPAIGGEELYAMFNDIIDFVQAQEVGQSHVFSSLREESETILKDPEAYFHHVVGLGKGWMDRGIGWAKCWVKNEKKSEAVATPPQTKMEDVSPDQEAEEKEPEEELSDFEKAELEDRKEGEDEEREGPTEKKSVGTQNFVSKPKKEKSKPISSKTKKAVTKKKGE